MEFKEALPFLGEHHRVVVTTFRHSGAAQMSIVRGGPYQGSMAFTARGATAKVSNLRHDPRCTVLAVTDNWRSYVTVEGKATIHGWDDTDPGTLRVMLRAVYAAAGGQHPDLDEYDRVMKEEQRAVVLVSPERVYGLIR